MGLYTDIVVYIFLFLIVRQWNIISTQCLIKKYNTPNTTYCELGAVLVRYNPIIASEVTTY